MTVEEVRKVIRGHWQELADLGVVSLRIIGSVARGEAGPASDVDLLIELDPERTITLLGFSGIHLVLEDMLGTKVDLVEPQCIREQWRDSILAEAVDAA